MQLFAVGLVMLNEDGSARLDADGKPMPTFNEDMVKGYAKALSGWTLDVRPVGRTYDVVTDHMAQRRQGGDRDLALLRCHGASR